MAYIGLYGVYYSVCDINASTGKLDGYSGTTYQMGKAISASFEPADANDNPLYANNGIAETDASIPSGGTLTLTLDRLKADAIVNLFGLTLTTETTTVGTASFSGAGFDYTGNETSNAVGVAFIRQKQEDNDRNKHEVIIYSHVTFALPSEQAETLGESIEWQTPEIEGTIAGYATVGDLFPWKKSYTFETQAAAQQFIQDYFSQTAATT